MLQLEDYNVILRLLDRDNLDLVRTWRNDPRINQYLIGRDFISQDKQEEWFQKLDTTKNQYFIIQYRGMKVGLVQICRIDHAAKSGYPGIFIYQEDHGSPYLPFQAMFTLNDYCFSILGLDRLYVEVFKSNTRAIHFDKAFGYELVPEAGTGEYDVFTVTKEVCLRKTEPLRTLIRNRKL